MNLAQERQWTPSWKTLDGKTGFHIRNDSSWSHCINSKWSNTLITNIHVSELITVHLDLRKMKAVSVQIVSLFGYFVLIYGQSVYIFYDHRNISKYRFLYSRCGTHSRLSTETFFARHGDVYPFSSPNYQYWSILFLSNTMFPGKIFKIFRVHIIRSRYWETTLQNVMFTHYGRM